MEVDESGFTQALEEHRIASGSGEAFGPLGGDGVEVYREILSELQSKGAVGSEGVAYDPYRKLEASGPLLALLKAGEPVRSAGPST